MSALLPASLTPTLPYLGLVQGMEAGAYRAQGGLSYTGLKWMARSPGHFFANVRDEARPLDAQTAGQLAGELTHCATLEPGEYPFRYFVGPEQSRASREWKECAARHPNHVCIKPGQHAAAMAQAASVRRDPDIAKLLASGEPEVSAFWRDPATGVLCQCRPDWVHPVPGVGVILLDLKTYSDASPEEFARQVGRMRYHWQAAWYTDGYSIAAGVPVVGFVFLAVETDYPYACKAHMLDEASLDVARREMAPLVEAYARCEQAGHWPMYPPGIAQITLPRWYAERGAED